MRVLPQRTSSRAGSAGDPRGMGSADQASPRLPTPSVPTGPSTGSGRPTACRAAEAHPTVASGPRPSAAPERSGSRRGRGRGRHPAPGPRWPPVGAPAPGGHIPEARRHGAAAAFGSAESPTACSRADRTVAPPDDALAGPFRPTAPPTRAARAPTASSSRAFRRGSPAGEARPRRETCPRPRPATPPCPPASPGSPASHARSDGRLPPLPARAYPPVPTRLAARVGAGRGPGRRPHRGARPWPPSAPLAASGCS